ncbi:hypothetical protein J2752_000901 [Halarchaeum rubridurum]|uniref:Uncharacterized protein n=1 Tax=Halarchaeum rubridurum TaxID=489911 RepID=A0A830FTA6_9EURY|nr:DUF5813 family protein [Halarchaeum rubridurum]MBP1954020.1 hypothetical protein [Halarchaeum rubridurum]GGM56706.1 hypothetical protein GCM10009017_03590 [Halarchaeum rubridurum]
MSDGDIRGAFAAHPKFEDAGDDAYAPTTNDWDATVTVAEGSVTVTVRVPTLSASVTAHDEVADVVEEGWFETLELRLDDATNVTRAEAKGEPMVERDDGEVVFEATIDARRENVADDALAVVNYVEGTWFEGIIPGYDYREDVQDLRDRAAGNAQADRL